MDQETVGNPVNLAHNGADDCGFAIGPNARPPFGFMGCSVSTGCPWDWNLSPAQCEVIQLSSGSLMECKNLLKLS